ncbi:MAG: hypothetical protein ABIZ81_10770 [Opitutaceae bacterium]
MTSLLYLQLECDRAAREVLAIPSWKCERRKVTEAINLMTGDSRRSTEALAWLIIESGKLPMSDEPARKLNELVRADAELRAARKRPEAVRELFQSMFPGRVRETQETK